MGSPECVSRTSDSEGDLIGLRGTWSDPILSIGACDSDVGDGCRDGNFEAKVTVDDDPDRER